MRGRDARRRALSAVMSGLCVAAVLVALVPLAMILFFVVSQGIGAIDVAFFTEMPRPVGEAGVREFLKP